LHNSGAVIKLRIGMKNLTNSLRAFTLIELLVVISIIAILASLAIPAVTGALTRGQMTGSLNNARQLTIASQAVALDSFTSGDTNIPGWPGANSFSKWATDLTNSGISTNDLRKLLSAPGKQCDDSFGASSAAWKVYGVIESDPGDSIIMTTANWDASQRGQPSGEPFGDKGFIVFRKGGDGGVYRSAQADNQPEFFGNPTVKPVLQ